MKEDNATVVWINLLSFQRVLTRPRWHFPLLSIKPRYERRRRYRKAARVFRMRMRKSVQIADKAAMARRKAHISPHLLGSQYKASISSLEQMLDGLSGKPCLQEEKLNRHSQNYRGKVSIRASFLLSFERAAKVLARLLA